MGAGANFRMVVKVGNQVLGYSEYSLYQEIIDLIRLLKVPFNPEDKDEEYEIQHKDGRTIPCIL